MPKKIATENLQQVVLVLDTREKEDVRQAFKDMIQSHYVGDFDENDDEFDRTVQPFLWKETACQVGDFWIFRTSKSGEEEPLIGFERKTWNDYLGSLEKGRLHDQRHRLLKTEHRAVFLIEGRRTSLVVYKKRDRVQCEAFLDYSQVRDGMSVWYTESLEESVLRIERLMGKIRDRTFMEARGGSKSFAECQTLEKKNGLTHDECYLAQLAQVPKVTVPFARKIIQKYPSFPSLCAAIVSDRAEVIRDIGDMMLTEKRRYGYICSARFVQYVSQETHEGDSIKKRARSSASKPPAKRRRKTPPTVATLRIIDDDEAQALF